MARRRKKKQTDIVDICIASHMAALRAQRGMSLQEMAAALGVSYQQVQKYERAANRVAASTLYRAARVLDVPVGVFFTGLPDF